MIKPTIVATLMTPRPAGWIPQLVLGDSDPAMAGGQYDSQPLMTVAQHLEILAAQQPAAVDEVREALEDTAQALAWLHWGACRGFSPRFLSANEALEKARAAIAGGAK